MYDLTCWREIERDSTSLNKLVRSKNRRGRENWNQSQSFDNFC